MRVMISMKRQKEKAMLEMKPIVSKDVVVVVRLLRKCGVQDGSVFLMASEETERMRMLCTVWRRQYQIPDLCRVDRSPGILSFSDVRGSTGRKGMQKDVSG